METEEITIGVRYQPLGDDTENTEVGIYRRHWVLVFSGREYAFKIEAGTAGAQNDLVMTTTPCERSYHAFRLGTFHGELSDLRKIFSIHAQRGTTYSTLFNNCQHFVAIYLLFLNAYADQRQGRYFRIDRGDRYAGIKWVLKTPKGHVWNNPNLILTVAGATTLGIGFRTTRGAVSTVGRLGDRLGAADILVVRARIAYFSTPIVVGCVCLAGGAYLWKAIDWGRKTLFDNPLVVGYPLGPAPSLSVQDHPIDWETTGEFVLNSKNSVSATLASAEIVEKYFSDPRASKGAEACNLFELAGKLIK